MPQRVTSFFQSRLATESFIMLLFGTVLIILASNVLVTLYSQSLHPHPSTTQLSMMLERAVLAAEPASFHHDSKRLPDPKPPMDPLLRVDLGSRPLSGAVVVVGHSASSIHHVIREHRTASRFSVRLKDGRWLNVHIKENSDRWMLLGFAVAAFVLFLTLIFLCAWAVKRLALPFRAFAEASKRFGVDVQAPPLAVEGSPEMREAIQAYNEMQNRIRRLLHDRTQMLAAISHDLRTPITRLQLRAEYLKDSGQYDKAIADLAEMEKMISSILSFARDYINTENTEKFDINALLESICNDQQDVGKQVAFSGVGRLTYFGRMVALKRALSNLIENAIKYGGQADVVLKEEHNLLYIKISDQGPGVPEDQLEKVFEPFYRVDPARSPQTTGTGLGLAVARDIIRAHGGEIELLNQSTSGLMVIVSLPQYESAASA